MEFCIESEILSVLKQDTEPAFSRKDFGEIFHRYPAGFSQSDFLEGNIMSNQTKFAVLSQNPKV